MTFDDKSGRWSEIRKYALGKEAVDKYKQIIEREPPKGTYLNIDWGVKKVVSKLISKMKKRFNQYVKNYKMVLRLKKS